MMEIVVGLNLSSVQRLEKTWGSVPPKYINVFNNLMETTTGSYNYKVYRETEAAASPPLICYIGDLLPPPSDTHRQTHTYTHTERQSGNQSGNASTMNWKQEGGGCVVFCLTERKIIRKGGFLFVVEVSRGVIRCLFVCLFVWLVCLVVLVCCMNFGNVLIIS